MKYLLIVFYVTGWPWSTRLEHAQLGPYDSILACERALVTAKMVVESLGAERVGAFCSETKMNWKAR